MDADLLIVGGRVFRGFGPGERTPHGSDEGQRPADAPTAVAVVDDRIAWVGSDADAIADWRGPQTEVVDARGGLVMAGFEDAHIHLLSGARSLDEVDLFGAQDVATIQDRVRAHAAAHRDAPWVLGRGWLYVPFPGGLPTREQLDAAVPDRPAWMTCYDGHTGWANTRGLAAAGIDRHTPDPAGGVIVRDSAGDPTGAVKESAVELVHRVLPSPVLDDDLAALRRTVRDLHAAGITAVQEAWCEQDDLPVWRRLLADGGLGVRARLAFPMTPDISIEQWQQRLEEYQAAALPLRGGLWLSAGILKAFADGVIESRTAALLAPYEGGTSTGHSDWTPDVLGAFVREADARDWQIEIHAIGDRGVRMTLDAFERVAFDNGPRARRHRVEHVETADAADIPRFGKLGVIASMQPYHADPSPNQISLWAGSIGPDRASRAWPWASILRHGGTVAFGSDWPVVPFDPFIALNSAVNRQTVDGEPPGGWLPSERLTVPQALSAYTVGSARAARADGRRGTLVPGLDADLVVLDRDLLEAGASAIIGTRIGLTVVGGRIVHRTEDAS